MKYFIKLLILLICIILIIKPCIVIMDKYNALSISAESLFEFNDDVIKKEQSFHEKICISRCSRMAPCESVVYINLSSTCILYWSRLNEQNVSTGKKMIRIFNKISPVQQVEVIQNFQPNYTVFYFQQLKDETIASGCSDGTVRIYNISQNKMVREYSGHVGYVRVIIEMTNGDLASGAADSKVIVWDRNTGGQKLVFTKHTGSLYALAELSNGMFASGGQDSVIKIWNPSTGQLIYNYNKGYYITAIKLSKTSQVIVSFHDKTIEIWNFDMSSLVTTLTGRTGTIFSICVLDNNLMVSGYGTGAIEIWNLTTSQRIYSFTAHKDMIFGLKELNNEYLVSGSLDKKIKIWSLNTGQLIKTISIHSYSVFGLEISSGGYIVSSAWDNPSGAVYPPIRIFEYLI